MAAQKYRPKILEVYASSEEEAQKIRRAADDAGLTTSKFILAAVRPLIYPQPDEGPSRLRRAAHIGGDGTIFLESLQHNILGANALLAWIDNGAGRWIMWVLGTDNKRKPISSEANSKMLDEDLTEYNMKAAIEFTGKAIESIKDVDEKEEKNAHSSGNDDE